MKRKVTQTHCEMRAVVLPAAPSEMRVGPRVFQKCPVYSCVCSAVALNPEVEALSCVHITQSVCRTTPTPTEQRDLHPMSARCGQTDELLGNTAKSVNYPSMLQPRRHLSCRKAKSFSQIPHISPRRWRLPDFLSLHSSLPLF